LSSQGLGRYPKTVVRNSRNSVNRELDFEELESAASCFFSAYSVGTEGLGAEAASRFKLRYAESIEGKNFPDGESLSIFAKNG
jgi:hypothetical protein